MRRSFDVLARPYRWLEAAAFGGALQRARVAHLGEISEPQNVLILGEGDGRFLEAFRGVYPDARVHVVDGSAAMAELARGRDRSGNTTFTVADATRVELPSGEFDLIVTHFFLDCFPEATVEALVSKLSRSASQEATWLIADFNLPERGLARWHARRWLAVMYFCFWVATGLPGRRLADVEGMVRGAGFEVEGDVRWRWGLVRSMRCARRGTTDIA